MITAILAAALVAYAPGSAAPVVTVSNQTQLFAALTAYTPGETIKLTGTWTKAGIVNVKVPSLTLDTTGAVIGTLAITNVTGPLLVLGSPVGGPALYFGVQMAGSTQITLKGFSCPNGSSGGCISIDKGSSFILIDGFMNISTHADGIDVDASHDITATNLNCTGLPYPEGVNTVEHPDCFQVQITSPSYNILVNGAVIRGATQGTDAFLRPAQANTGWSNIVFENIDYLGTMTAAAIDYSTGAITNVKAFTQCDALFPALVYVEGPPYAVVTNSPGGALPVPCDVPPPGSTPSPKPVNP